jgi:hypothetical protein
LQEAAIYSAVMQETISFCGKQEDFVQRSFYEHFDVTCWAEEASLQARKEERAVV